MFNSLLLFDKKRLSRDVPTLLILPVCPAQQKGGECVHPIYRWFTYEISLNMVKPGWFSIAFCILAKNLPPLQAIASNSSAAAVAVSSASCAVRTWRPSSAVSTCIDVSCKGCGGPRGNGSFGVEIKDPHHGVSVLKGSTWMISGYPRFRKLSPWIPFEITFHFHFNTIKTQTVYRKNTSKSRFLGQSHFPRRKSAARRSVSAVPRGRYDQAELLRELQGPHVQGWMKKLWLNGILGYFMMIHESLVT